MDEAIRALYRVAAELTLCRDVPDPDMPEFRPIGRRATREIIANQNMRAHAIVQAIDDIRATLKSL